MSFEPFQKDESPRPRFVLLLWEYMKPYAESFYKSATWQKTAKAYSKSVGGLCERCREQNIIKAGELVHHKIHITPANIHDERVTLDWNNLQLVCRECHAELHGTVKRYTVDSQGRVTAI